MCQVNGIIGVNEVNGVIGVNGVNAIIGINGVIWVNEVWTNEKN